MDGPRFRTMRQSSGVKGSFVCLKDLSKLCFLQRALSDPCRAPSPHLCQEIGSALLGRLEESPREIYQTKSYKIQIWNTMHYQMYQIWNMQCVFLRPKVRIILAKTSIHEYVYESKESLSNIFRWFMMERFPSRSQKNRLSSIPFPAPSFRRIFPSNEHQWAVGIVRFWKDPLWLDISVKKKLCGLTSSSARSARTTHFLIHRQTCRLPCTACLVVLVQQSLDPSRLSIDLLQCLLQFSSLWCLAGDVACCGLLWMLFQRFQSVKNSLLKSFLRSLDKKNISAITSCLCWNIVEIMSGMRWHPAATVAGRAVLQQHLLHLKTIGFTLESWLGDRFVGVYSITPWLVIQNRWLC